jgi:hypothetical protein
LKPVCQLFRVRRIDSGFASCPEEPFDACVTEALDHVLSVAHHASGRQCGSAGWLILKGPGKAGPSAALGMTKRLGE